MKIHGIEPSTISCEKIDFNDTDPFTCDKLGDLFKEAQAACVPFYLVAQVTSIKTETKQDGTTRKVRFRHNFDGISLRMYLRNEIEEKKFEKEYCGKKYQEGSNSYIKNFIKEFEILNPINRCRIEKVQFVCLPCFGNKDPSLAPQHPFPKLIERVYTHINDSSLFDALNFHVKHSVGKRAVLQNLYLLAYCLDNGNVKAANQCFFAIALRKGIVKKSDYDLTQITQKEIDRLVAQKMTQINE